uniref:Retrovirus-related Pol polyprotein from transposon TNT 1-94 n=1 Tax=Tanacetum cinerariifolium TaxID=118510 RepID=A0A6L2LRE1_TANCI|nr:retrovirus-related Pol polyprotein from transposon TNT 1-94 [Tanacetum cinerariifolium]
MESHDDGSKREGVDGKSIVDELMARLQNSQAETNKGNACKGLRMTGSPKMIYSPLVPLTTVGDLQMLINDIDAGKHDELLTEMTNNDREETLYALGTICNSIQADNPIVQSVDINTKSTSYAGAAGARAKDQPKVSSNFRPSMADLGFHGVNISIPRKVVEKGKHGLKRIIMNTKGLFVFKFDSKAGLEAVLESGPWMIHQTSIILKKWSMSTSLQKEELTRIPIWVKLHDVPLQVFEGDDVITIGIPSLTRDDFTKETICVEYEWRPPRYEPKENSSAPKKEATNVSNPSKSSSMLKTADTFSKKDNFATSNSFSALNNKEEDDKEVENVYDESANLYPHTKTDESPSYTAAVENTLSKHKLLRIEMHGDETLDAYLNRAQEYVDALTAIGEPVKDKVLVMLVVSVFVNLLRLSLHLLLQTMCNSNKNHGNRNNSRGNNNNRGHGNGHQFDWASIQNTVYDTCNRCGIGHIPSQCPNHDPSTIRTRSSANFANTRAQSSNASANWHSDTRANSYVTSDLKAMDNSEAYYGDDALHVGNAVEAPQTLEYRGIQLNAALVLEVEIFTNWKKRLMCHIIGIEPQFENIIKNGPFILMTVGQKKPENQWTGDERKAANLDQRLKSLIIGTRSSHEYLNDLEEEYQARALLAKSKIFFKKSTQLFSSTKASDQTECHKYGNKGHFARDRWSKTPVSTHQSPFQPKPLSSLQHKPELRHTKDFEAKYNKVKAKLALLSSSASASKASMVKNKGLISEAYEWDGEEVSSDENDGGSENPSSFGQKDLVFVKSLVDDTKVYIPGVERPWLSKAEGFILPNHDTGRILPAESQRNTNDLAVVVTDSSTTDYDSTDESSVCSTPLPLPKKLDAPVEGNKISSASKVHSAFVGKLKNVKIEDDPSLATLMKRLNDIKLQISKNQSSHSRNNQPQQCHIRKPIWYLDSGCSRHMTGVKSHLHKYIEQSRTKVVFGDDSACTTISQLCDAKYIVKFDEKRGSIFNSNKEVVMIAPRVMDVYVLDETYSAQESCFFAKAFENLKWLWHKRLACLNFKTINKVAKQNFVIGLLLLVCSKDKPCSSCEKVKHHRASFKTKQTSSIKKCLNLLHMYSFGPVTPRSINHEKHTLVFVDEYSRYTWVYFLKKKSQAPETIMSFIKRVKNQNDIKAKQLKTDNVYIHNHKDDLGKFDEKADDGYLLGYSLVSMAFRVFKTRRQQTEETYHITFDESLDAIKFLKPSEDNINIAETERYPPDEYLHPYETSQRYQTNNNDVPFIEPYECPKPIVPETKVSSDHNGQIDQNDQSVLNDEILNNDHSEHSNHTNDEQIIDNLPNTKDIQISEYLSSPTPQDRWSQDKHIELVNIIGNPEAEMLTRAMAKQLSAASAHECLFVDFLSEEKPKKIKQSKRGISINQEKYVKDLLKKYDINGSSVKTPMVPPNNLGPDLSGKAVNETQYRDSDYAGCNMDRKSTSGAYQLLGGKLVCWSAKKQQYVAMFSPEAEYVAVAGCCANILWMKS